jgi:dienelactone hydrolase
MKSLLFITVILFSSVANAAIKTQTIEYKEGDTTLEGYLAYDTAGAAKKPGVLVVHDWTGLRETMKKKAEALAKLGYVAFAADIYGKGVRPTDPTEAGKTAGIYKNNRTLLRARAAAGLNELEKQPNVDKSKIAAIGFCFGGTTVLELARSGADINGIVTFHGGLDSPHPEDGKNIKAKVLILHGADDPYVPADQVKAVESELTNAKVDWQLVKYSGAVHSFTIPEAGNDNSKGAAYNERADKRSWQAMRDFFNEIFK